MHQEPSTLSLSSPFSVLRSSFVFFPFPRAPLPSARLPLAFPGGQRPRLAPSACPRRRSPRPLPVRDSVAGRRTPNPTSPSTPTFGAGLLTPPRQPVSTVPANLVPVSSRLDPLSYGPAFRDAS